MAVVPKQDSLQMLKKLIPLNLLSDGDLEQLMETAVFKKERAGSYLFRQGDTDYHNIYLLSGRVALLDNVKEVDRVAAGSETGRFPLAHQIPRKNSARAIGAVEYVLIDNRKLSELLVRSKDDDYKVADLNSTVSDNWMDQLLQSKVFQQIPPSNIQGVIMRMEEIQVKRGEKVVKQGGEGDYFYLIHQGRCTISRKEEGKRKSVELAKLGPGDSFGEEALLSDSPRNSTVSMLTNGTLLRLAKEDFIEFVKRPLAIGVSYEEADAQVAKGAVWLDVRSPADYAAGHLDHSVSFPMETLRYQAPNLASDQKYVLCCNDGHLSSTAAYLLTDRGFSLSVLEGGLRTVPSDLLVREKASDAESSAKVISLHPGEEIADGTGAKVDDTEVNRFKDRLSAANERIKDLGVKFKSYRERQKKDEAVRQAEIKAQKVIIDKSRLRVDELKARRDSDRRLIEQLQQDSGELNASLKEALEKLEQATESIVDLEGVLKGERDSRQAISLELDKNKEVLEDATADKVELEIRIAELEKGRGEVKQENNSALEKAEQQIKQLGEDLGEVQREYKVSQSKLEEAKSALLDKKADQQIVQLQDELEKAQERDRALQSELDEAKGLLLAREAEMEELSVETDLPSAEETDALRAEIKTLTEALSEADLAYDQIREPAETLSQEKDQLNLKIQELAHTNAQQESADPRTSIDREVFGDVYDDLVSMGLEKAEEESLRQELDDLRNTSKNWEERLNKAEDKCRNLDDTLEDRDKEIDQIKLELDENRSELEEADKQRQLSEETANQLREMAAQGVTANEYIDPRLADSPKTLHMDHLVSGQSPKRAMSLWILLGMGICFIALEAVMFLSGRGELITSVFTGGKPKQVVSGDADKNNVGKLSPSIQSMFGVGSKKTDSKPNTSLETKKGAPKPELSWTILNDISFGPVMIKLGGGSYAMGSNRSQVSSNQWPAHEVRIKAFAISQTEVTFEDYDRFAQATGRKLPKDEGWGRGKRPVVNVSWNDAVAYTEWLSERTGKKYRLPTEAEWEYAISSGSDSSYWWGYGMEEGRSNCFDCGSEWDRTSTAPVASFRPNNFGLYDMAGNVREWVFDCYHPNYSGAPLDGSAWIERGCSERVVRGGAYNKISDSMRSIWRGHLKPDLRFTYTGFRVVREL